MNHHPKTNEKPVPLDTVEEQLGVGLLDLQCAPLAELTSTPLDLSGVPSLDLRDELARGLRMTAEGLMRMGLVWQELERRGEDLSDLRRGIALYLPLIAAGQLAAEAVVAFASRRSVLRALEGVPLDEQRRLATGGTLPVIDPTNPERIEEVALGNIPARMLHLVFDGGTVREPKLQRLALRPAERTRREVRERSFRPRFDPATGTLAIGRMTVQLADLLKELAASAGPDKPQALIEGDEYLHVKVRLTREEYERYQALCRRVELPDWEMARKALRAFGLI